MKIESLDLFYLSMPVIADAPDGSQDALVVRAEAGGCIGWGECEASPLTSIAAFVCPASHSACRPVGDSVLGQTISGPQDIARIAAALELNSMDLLQTAHTWSGIEIALWDLLGKKLKEPVYRLLGYPQAYPKRPYASMLFGDTPQETFDRCRKAHDAGFRAVKCGWGPFGRGSVKQDADQIVAAREAIGPQATLLIDAGQIWGEDVEAAASRLPALEEAKVAWLEEPFHGSAYAAYAGLAARSNAVRLAGGEASHNEFMARHLMDYGRVGFVQIDCGRIGGIGPAKRVADRASRKGITYVNHTYTSHLALCASIQPYAGLRDHSICEYPVSPQAVAWDMTATHLLPDSNGEIRVPEAPGLGIDISIEGMRNYLVDAEIKVNRQTIYRTPSLT
jgi:L-alanine-DL-glutamate epimerase-like enolase superfamily enzyme